MESFQLWTLMEHENDDNYQGAMWDDSLERVVVKQVRECESEWPRRHNVHYANVSVSPKCKSRDRKWGSTWLYHDPHLFLMTCSHGCWSSVFVRWNGKVSEGLLHAWTSKSHYLKLFKVVVWSSIIWVKWSLINITASLKTQMCHLIIYNFW